MGRAKMCKARPYLRHTQQAWGMLLTLAQRMLRSLVLLNCCVSQHLGASSVVR